MHIFWPSPTISTNTKILCVNYYYDVGRALLLLGRLCYASKVFSARNCASSGRGRIAVRSGFRPTGHGREQPKTTVVAQQ